MERLSEEEINILKNNDANSDEVISLVKKTYKNVMAVNPDKPEDVFASILTLDREYEVKGKNIPILFKSIPDFTEDGDITDKEKEISRQNNMISVRNQIIPILSANIDCEVKVILEIF